MSFRETHHAHHPADLWTTPRSRHRLSAYSPRSQSPLNPKSVDGFNADNSITQLKPHVILAMVGTVDVRRGNISQGPKDLRNMLTDIFTQSPNSWVILSTIPPLGSQVKFSDQVTGYNKAIMNVAAEFPRVSTIDFYTACNK